MNISDEKLKSARRKTSRRVAAALIAAMAETDIDYEEMGIRLGEKPETIRKWIIDFVDCKSKDLDLLSDLCLAMNAEVNFTLHSWRKTEAEYKAEKAEKKQAA
jgi:hypothetical protein